MSAWGLVLFTIIPTAFGISCFQHMSLNKTTQEPITLAQGCAGCAKLIVVYKTPTMFQKMVRWQCVNRSELFGIPSIRPTSASSPSGQEICQPTTTAVAYNDGGMFSVACVCCESGCNGDASFCVTDSNLATCVGISVPTEYYSDAAIAFKNREFANGTSVIESKAVSLNTPTKDCDCNSATTNSDIKCLVILASFYCIFFTF